MSGFNQLLRTSVWFMTAVVIVNDFVLLGGQIHELCRYNSESRVAWLVGALQTTWIFCWSFFPLYLFGRVSR